MTGRNGHNMEQRGRVRQSECGNREKILRDLPKVDFGHGRRRWQSSHTQVNCNNFTRTRTVGRVGPIRWDQSRGEVGETVDRELGSSH